jgi:hypothetical protein
MVRDCAGKRLESKAKFLVSSILVSSYSIDKIFNAAIESFNPQE